MSSGMLRRVAVVTTDVSEEFSGYIVRVTRISELGTTLAVTSSQRASVAVSERECHAKNAFFWVVTPYRSFRNQRFGGMYRLHDHGD
jgi:hypothetical protein